MTGTVSPQADLHPPAPVLAAKAWPTNAHLIADVAKLGYLRKHDVVLDPTWGDGVWWKAWSPTWLISPREGTDFRHLPYDDDAFDAVAYDPPYVCPGGRVTSGIKGMYRRYGILDAPRTPAELQELMDDGLAECARLVYPSARRAMSADQNGVILMKCQDYVSGGKLWPGTYLTLKAAERLGLVLEDRFEFLGGIRPQPGGRVQRHARRNLSTLLVLRKLR